jgi:integrase
MPRPVRDAKLDSRTARAKLPISGAPRYVAIAAGVHLGYRRNANGGKWVVRLYLDGKYQVFVFADTDDRLDADGETILNFHQAQARAREIASNRRKGPASAGPLTIGDMLDDYLRQKADEGGKDVEGSRGLAERHIRPRLGRLDATGPLRAQIASWLRELADRPRHTRGKAGLPARALAAPVTDDEKRRRRASANRVFVVLSAALNLAFQDGRIPSDSEWRRVKRFPETDAPRVRFFSKDELQRLTNAADESFRALINGGLFSACRYGELTRMVVADFDRDNGALFVGQSKSGRSRHVVLSDEGRSFFVSITAGRSPHALMFTKDDGSAWGATHQAARMRRACLAARRRFWVTPARR